MMAKCLRDLPGQGAQAGVRPPSRMSLTRVEPILKQSRRTGRQKAPTGWLGRKIRDAGSPDVLEKQRSRGDRALSFSIDWEKRVA